MFMTSIRSHSILKCTCLQPICCSLSKNNIACCRAVVVKRFVDHVASFFRTFLKIDPVIFCISLYTYIYALLRFVDSCSIRFIDPCILVIVHLSKFLR